MAVGFGTAIKNLEEQAQVTLFFKDEYPEAQILALRESLLKDERILDVTYISKEDAFKIFTDINKDEPILLEAVSKDVLPASLEIKTKKLVSLSEVADQFKGHEGVEEVKFFRDVVDRFKYWALVISIVGGLLAAVFTALSFAIILATLRISIAAKGDEIEITKLVGGTDDYVRRPFITQGVSFGMISGILASLILLIVFAGVGFFGLFSFDSRLALIGGLRVASWIYMILLVLLLLGLGWLLGYFGSKAAVKRYLKF
jgi:cell division transport system permease protein